MLNVVVGKVFRSRKNLGEMDGISRLCYCRFDDGVLRMDLRVTGDC